MRLRSGTFLALFHLAGEHPRLAFKTIKEQMPGEPRKAS